MYVRIFVGKKDGENKNYKKMIFVRKKNGEKTVKKIYKK